MRKFSPARASLSSFWATRTWLAAVAASTRARTTSI